MTNHIKWVALATVLGAFIAGEAQAIAINRCVKVVRNPQVSRETLVNTCEECLVAKIERRRPGSTIGVPSMRDVMLPGRTSQPLPFMGPGKTRIMSEAPCPKAP